MDKEVEDIKKLLNQVSSEALGVHLHHYNWGMQYEPDKKRKREE